MSDLSLKHIPTYQQLKPIIAVARRGGNVAGIAKQALEAETGKPVITSQNAAQLNAVVTGMIEAVVDAEKKKDKAEKNGLQVER